MRDITLAALFYFMSSMEEVPETLIHRRIQGIVRKDMEKCLLFYLLINAFGLRVPVSVFVHSWLATRFMVFTWSRNGWQGKGRAKYGNWFGLHLCYDV